MDIPFVNLRAQHSLIKKRLLESVGAVLDHGAFILGPEVEQFEKRFAEFCGVRYAVGVDNGTNALLLSLRALGIGPGDEVITAANSFLASASSIALTGARPVLVDVKDDFTIDPECAERAITTRTRAIMPVHLTGRPAAMDIVCDLARRNGIAVVEDAAQAFGAEFQQRRVGSFGVAGCFSMHPLKVLNAVGDGGMITTNDAALYGRLLIARNHGLRSRDECEMWSYNARLDTIQAAMLLVKMEYVQEWIDARRAIASYYRAALRRWVLVPEEQPGEKSVYQTFVIRCERRDELRRFLSDRGVESKVHYPIPLYKQDAAAGLGYLPGEFPNTDKHASSIVSLPIYPELTGEQLEYIAGVMGEFYGN